MATISTPARQPFGVLNESKLRSLQSIKNRQNALTPSSAPSLKRRAPSPELSDSENIDPTIIDSSIKRKRASFDDDVSLAKQPRYTTHIVPSSTKTYTPPSTTHHTSRLDAFSRPTTSTPLSAPAAAGRSPTRLINKHRIDKSSLQPRRRFLPPTLGPSTSSPSLSIASALRGTLAHKKSARAHKQSRASVVEETKPKSWFFEIFEEAEEMQDYRMCEWTMTQSSAALEISDDDGKLKSFDGAEPERADRGKENIDPNETSVTSAPVTRGAAAAAAREAANEKQAEMKSEEPRTPLGDLNAAAYYGEGLDATSVVLVHDDDDDGPTEETAEAAQDTSATAPAPGPTIETTAQPLIAEDFNFNAPLTAQREPGLEATMPAEEIPAWAQRAPLTLGADAKENNVDSAVLIYQDGTEPADIDIEIWESESARDENENENENCQEGGQGQSGAIVVGEGERVSVSAFCLQEL